MRVSNLPLNARNVTRVFNPCPCRRHGLKTRVTLMLLTLIAGCEVGPNYQRPSIETPGQYKSIGYGQTESNAPKIPANWWELYHDRELNQLMGLANAYNQDLRQAVARVEEARAQARIAAADLLPTATFDPAWTRYRESGTRISPQTGGRTPAFTFNDYLVPIDLNYQVDIFGRIRRQVEAANAQARASQFDQAAVQLTVDTDVAIYYFALRSLDAQVNIVRRSVDAFKEQVRIVSVQLKNGLISPVDLYQAQAQLDATLAQQRDLERSRADEENALALLCGRPAPLFAIAPNPLEQASPPQVPPGLPAQQLARRPDVAEAEQNLVAANAQIGVATAQFYPTFNLTGSAGFESASASDIFNWQSKIASFGPSVSFPIFEGGRLINNLKYTQARYREFLAAYTRQVLTAYSDVESALTDLHALTDETTELRSAVDVSGNYLRTSRVQYQRGLVNYLTVIDAERTTLSNQLSLAQAINQEMAASVRLISALGGGWTAPESGSNAQQQGDREIAQQVRQAN
jgi:multidrug efflux system outer membrane protein